MFHFDEQDSNYNMNQLLELLRYIPFFLFVRKAKIKHSCILISFLLFLHLPLPIFILPTLVYFSISFTLFHHFSFTHFAEQALTWYLRLKLWKSDHHVTWTISTRCLQFQTPSDLTPIEDKGDIWRNVKRVFSFLLLLGKKQVEETEEGLKAASLRGRALIFEASHMCLLKIRVVSYL